MDIITGFEPVVVGSSPAEGTMHKSKFKIMKKILLLFFVSFAFLFLFSGIVQAKSCPGFEKSLVPCGQLPECPCEFTDFFAMLMRIYIFTLAVIVAPVAGLMIVISGVLYIVSAGNPGVAGTAKNILKYTAISLALIFGSWLIIDVILKTIGYLPEWNVF